MSPVSYYLNALGVVSAAGSGQALLQNIQRGDRSGLQQTEYYSPGRPVFVGRVNEELPRIPDRYRLYDCRNNQLLLAALAQIKTGIERIRQQYSSDRIGVVLGTSTSGVRNTERALADVAQSGKKPAWFHYKQQQLGASADFLAQIVGVKGPAFTVSTACSSSGRALASARRLLALDLCDAVIVGGADSLCRFTVNGFMALESVSAGLCKPFGVHRDGINLSEAAALFILSKQPGPVKLTGIGASSDAYHFSAPDPSGEAVANAIRMAWRQAQLSPEQIDYVNLHGTATRLNDAMESRVMAKVFGETLPVSSSKGMAGHALGAAAALELALCWQLLRQEETLLPPNINADQHDPELPRLNYVQPGLSQRVMHCQSHSFAFGGNNISIIISRNE